jgi:hypothetical protein
MRPTQAQLATTTASTKTTAVVVARATWTVLVWTVAATVSIARALKGPMALIWHGTLRTARLVAWLCFWPLGLMLSLNHGATKRNRALVKAIRDSK